MKAAKARDEANADQRQKEIPIEIGSLNNKIEELKKKIENDRAVQEDLRSTFKTQSAIEQMKTKCQTDLEELKINISEYRFNCQAYRIAPPPPELPGDDTDKRGEELKKIMEGVNDEISGKLEDRERELEKHQDMIRRIEAIVSEKSALYNHGVQSIRQKQQRSAALKPSIDKTKKVVEELRSFEQREQKVPTPVAITDGRPEELLSYLTERVDDIDGHSTEDIPPKIIRKVLKKLFYLVRTLNFSFFNHDMCFHCATTIVLKGKFCNPRAHFCCNWLYFSKSKPVEPARDFSCPCCERKFADQDDFERFQKILNQTA